MVIRYNNLPFNFYIEEYTERLENEYSSNVNFFDSIDDLNKDEYDPQIIITENRIVKIKIDSNFPFKLEMDGLDSTSNVKLVHGDGFYLDKSGEYIEVFGRGEDFPLPPGLFVIKITINGKMYFTGFKVISARLSKDLWEIMANNVSESVKIMAFQLMISKLSIGDKKSDLRVFGELILKMNILNKYFIQVIAVLDDLSVRAHSKISKMYRKKHSEKSFLEDYKSYKLNTTKNVYEKIYVPEKYTNYNLSENRFIKSILIELDKILSMFINEIDCKLISLEYKRAYLRNNKNNDKNHVLKTLLQYRNKARVIKESIDKIRDTEWFKTIRLDSSNILPYQKMYDPRYGILSKLSSELKHHNIYYDINNGLRLLWKRSDKLYEMWGFLKIVEQFEEIGFSMINGSNIMIKNDNTITISSLDAGDYVQLQKDYLLIKIYYDKEIPYNQNVLIEDSNPIFVTCANNRPDIRIDFYYMFDENVKYVASLIIDLKYRNKNSIWKDGETGCKVQLKNYSSFTKTIFHLDYLPQKAINASNPVRQVWALYPNPSKISEENYKSGDSVRLISFVPGSEDVIIKHLENFIREEIDTDINIINRLMR